MKKKEKKKLFRLGEAMRRATLAVPADSAGIEKKIRAIWQWADDQVPLQNDIGKPGNKLGQFSSLRDFMAQALDALGQIVGGKLDPLPAPSSGVPKAGGTDVTLPTRTSRADDEEEDDDDPPARGTVQLSADQKKAAAKMGITDPALIEAIANSARSRTDKVSAAVVLAKASGRTTATDERAKAESDQLRVAQKLGLNEKQVAEVLSKIRARA